LIKNIKKELIALKNHMKKNGLAPSEPIIPDNHPRMYEVCIDGESRKGVYTATPYPFDKDPAGPVLVCSYGLIDEKERYSYSSLMKE